MLRAACLSVACSGGFLDACLGTTLFQCPFSSVMLNAGGEAPFIGLITRCSWNTDLAFTTLFVLLQQ